jgi:hypothetical protein
MFSKVQSWFELLLDAYQRESACVLPFHVSRFVRVQDNSRSSQPRNCTLWMRSTVWMLRCLLTARPLVLPVLRRLD